MAVCVRKWTRAHKNGKSSKAPILNLSCPAELTVLSETNLPSGSFLSQNHIKTFSETRFP